MIIIKIIDINFGLRNKPFNSYFRNNLDQIYSHVIFFLLKWRQFLYKYLFFFRISRVRFLNRNFPRKVAFFLYISYKKGYIRHIFWDRPCFTTIMVTNVCFFSDWYTWNAMYITYAKIKIKIHEPLFQTANYIILITFM